MTRALLNTGGFDWAYSEIFQNYDRGALEWYLPQALDINRTCGILVNFAETHDNNRLAAKSRAWAEMRTALCALSSVCGAFAFANGVEWLATEKISVHEAKSLNWGAFPNQTEHIRRLSQILRTHPAFFLESEIRMITTGGGNNLVLLRVHRPTGRAVLLAVNLDDGQPAAAAWPAGSWSPQSQAVDLLTGRPVDLRSENGRFLLDLKPGQVRLLSADPSDLSVLEQEKIHQWRRPKRVRDQILGAKALQVRRVYFKDTDLDGFDPTDQGRSLAADPEAYCQKMNPNGPVPNVALWQWPRDLNRTVMVPPGHFLLVRSAFPFRARILATRRVEGECLVQEESIRSTDGTWFALFTPFRSPGWFQPLTLRIFAYDGEKCVRKSGDLLFLPPAFRLKTDLFFPKPDPKAGNLLFLGTNGRGSMMRASAFWGRLDSRYDALLAANPSPEVPEDRWIMLTRIRAWVVFQGYSREIAPELTESFEVRDMRCGLWRFFIPTGKGRHVRMGAAMEMQPAHNRIRIRFYREASTGGEGRLADDKPVRLILRPDIEDRSFHDLTKAYTGPETRFSASVFPGPDGFSFSPNPGRCLRVNLSGGQFTSEPEWQYMVHRKQDGERGQDPDSDLFSPGWFLAQMKGGDQAVLEAEILFGAKPENGDWPESKLPERKELPVFTVMEKALAHYVVGRGRLATVIAGYPWFLDWGRDTLIFARGLAAAGKTKTVKQILLQCGRFEENGTLPNMIRGNDARDRDTSDAPLWFATVCADLTKNDPDFPLTPCSGRTLGQAVAAIARGYMEGTPNGIRMDPDSGLIFSPTHFTWMDTNFPAGSPRRGYPIEIQALWHAALAYLARVDQNPRQNWADLAQTVARSIVDLFHDPGRGFLSDCLHAPEFIPAKQARPDDALRPNQLFAVTLGAITDPEIQKQVVSACQTLIVPGAIRSLADRPLSMPLEILGADGRPLTDPHHPYQGVYAGDEDTQRKPAYHNGTAWTWVFPSFCEALYLAWGEKSRETALAYLASGARLLETGAAGHLSEILDGDTPHTPKGCDAQAWGASEFVRVWKLLQSE